MRHYGFIIKGVHDGKPWNDAWQVLAGSPKEARSQIDKGLAEEKAGGYDRQVQEVVQATDCDDDFEKGVEFYDKLCKKVEKMNAAIATPPAKTPEKTIQPSIEATS